MSEINHSLEHFPQEHGGVPIIKGGFFAIGQGAG